MRVSVGWVGPDEKKITQIGCACTNQIQHEDTRKRNTRNPSMQCRHQRDATCKGLNPRWNYMPSCRMHHPKSSESLDASLERALTAHETRVIAQEQGRRSRLRSALSCGPLYGALHRLRRAATGKLPRACHVVQVGDSHSLQACDAAVCELTGRLALTSNTSITRLHQRLSERMTTETLAAFAPYIIGAATNLTEQHVRVRSPLCG